MSVFIHAVIVVGLWFISNFISQWLFAGETCSFYSSTLFSWWFVAYFTKDSALNPVSLCVTYIVVASAVMSAHYAGYYDRFFPNVPNVWTHQWWLAVMILAFVMITPLILNMVVRYIRKALADA